MHVPQHYPNGRDSHLPADSLPTTKVNGVGRFAGGAASVVLAVFKNALSVALRAIVAVSDIKVH